VQTNGSIRSSVCTSALGIYLLSSDGLLYRINKDSGKVLGSYKTMTGYIGDRQNDFADYYTSSPVIVDSSIYFGCGDDIFAISMKSGELLWTYKTGGSVHTTPAISNNRLYAGSFDGHLYAINIKTGTLEWKFKSTGNYIFPKGEFMGNPVVASGMVFSGARDFNFYAVDQRGGYANWMKQFPQGWALPVTANDSILYVGTSDDRALYAYNIISGKEMWKTQAGFNILGGCAFGKTTGYFATLSGKVIGIDLKTGKIIWTIESESYKKNHLTYLNPDDSYRNDVGKLIKTPLDMLEMYRQLGGVFGKPAAAGDQMIVAGYDGWIYCYSKSPEPDKTKN
jgi:outer membrane protein assembly factor BamB